MNLSTLYKKINSLDSLAPSKEVNTAFTNLVEKAIKYESDGKLTPYEIKQLQILSAKAEYELELYWAKRIISSGQPKAELQKFPYMKNYFDLTKLEINSLRGCTNHLEHRFVFVGGGPLPMTAIVLAQEYGISSTVLDIDKDASMHAQKVVDLLRLTELITIKNCSGEEYDYKAHNVVYLAALAGLDTKSKKAVFNRIKETAHIGTHILARSSWRNRKLLYRPLHASIYKIFTPIIKVDPFNDIVNSIVILKYEE